MNQKQKTELHTLMFNHESQSKFIQIALWISIDSDKAVRGVNNIAKMPIVNTTPPWCWCQPDFVIHCLGI